MVEVGESLNRKIFTKDVTVKNIELVNKNVFFGENYLDLRVYGGHMDL